MNNRITVEVVKLPAARRTVTLFNGDTVERALFEAFGEENYSTYTIAVNGTAGELTDNLLDGSSIVITKQIKGNSDEVATEETEEVATEEVVATEVEATEETEEVEVDATEATA